MRFTPKEMAYEMPDDLSHLNYRRVNEGRTVVIDADVAKVFADDAAVNNALRKLMEALPQPPRRRKSA